MFDNIENLKLISAAEGTVKNGNRVENRKFHSLIFRTSGQVSYFFEDTTLTINTGELIYLPKGSSYEYTPHNETCSYMSISFDADISNAKPVIFKLDNFPDSTYIRNHFVNLWKLGNQSDKYKCYSLFYNLLSHISQNTNYSDSKKFDILNPALEYLKIHIFDSDLKTDTLHTLCGISDTYFRRIFTSKFGDTPQKYITNKRLSYAKSILDAGRTESISDLSVSVGYTDPLYFSRAFKKKYGVSPTESEREI